MKKFLLSLAVLFSMGAAANAEEATLDYTKAGISNGTELPTVTKGDVTITYDKGDNSSNAPKYYTSGSAARFYNGNKMTLTVPEGTTITAIDFAVVSNYSWLTGSSADKGELNTTDNTWTGSEQSVTIQFGTGGSGNTRLTGLTVTYTVGAAPTVAKPTFSPAAGEYYGAQTVTINCATEGATIEYSIDDKATWNAYTEAVTVDKTMTLWARATVGENVAENSAAYTIKSRAVYNSIAEMMSMDLPASKETSDEFVVNFDATVVYQSGSYTYIYDGKDYALYFKATPGLQQFNTLKAGWVAQLSNFNGLYELIPATTPELGEDATALPAATVATADDITAANQSKYILLKGVTLDAETPATAGSFTGTIGEATVSFFNRFTLPAQAAGTYDIPGFIAVYNNNAQVYPTAFETPQVEPAKPELVLDWETAVDANTNSTGESRFAAANSLTGEIYIVNKAAQKIYAMSKDGIVEKFNTEGKASMAITTAIGVDEAGNVICGLGWPNATMTKNLLLISADGSQMNEVDMTTADPEYKGGRTDFFGRVLGDMFGEGGMLNVFPGGQEAANAAIYSLNFANGGIAEENGVVASVSFENAGYSNPVVCLPMGFTYAEQVELGDAVGDVATPSYLYNRGTSFMEYDFDKSEYVKHASYDNNKPSCYGFEAFEMDGVTYYAQSTGKANYADGLVIYTIDEEGNNQVVASYQLDAAGMTSSNYVSINAFTRANGKTVDIYQFTAGKYGRHFIFGEIPEPVDVAEPTFDPESGEYAKGTDVTISCATEGAKLNVTINGAAAVEADAPYSFTLNEDSNVSVFAYVESEGVTYKSATVEAAYTVKEAPAPTGKVYELVKDNLKEGANYVIFGESTQKYSNVSYTLQAIMSSEITGTSTKPVFAAIEKADDTFSIENDVLTLAEGVTNVAIVTAVKGTGDNEGKWAFMLGEKYLMGGHATGNYMSLAETPYWATVAINEETGQATTTFDANPSTSNNVHFCFNINVSGANTWNPRFSCYKGAPNAQMASPYFYIDQTQSGVESVDVDNNENAPVEYYNLQGIRIANPAAGQILIRRQGSNVSKIIL